MAEAIVADKKKLVEAHQKYAKAIHKNDGESSGFVELRIEAKSFYLPVELTWQQIVDSFYKPLVRLDRPHDAGKWTIKSAEDQSVVASIGDDGTVGDIWERRGDDAACNMMKFACIKWV